MERAVASKMSKVFVISFKGYDNFGKELFVHISNNDVSFVNLDNNNKKIRYVLTADKNNTSKVIGNYILL